VGAIEDDSRAVADSLRRELALGDGLERFAGGSVPVFAAGDGHVVKLFPRAERAHFETERAALTRIDGRLPIPTPRAVAAGERGAWFYVAMTRLPGVSLAEAWPSIDRDGRVRLMRETGAGLAALHATATEGLEPLTVDWPAFMDAQRTSCRERQRAAGLDAPWLDAVEGFLARWMPRDAGERVLLHTEVMREHLLVESPGGAWRLSGLVDFEPAMMGAPEYEWASVGVFVTCGEPGLLGELLAAYGAEPDDELPLRIMAYALLHRYSRLSWYLERLPPAEKPGDLEALARQWFTATGKETR
jgi:hygromycin-B 7''-O-kinase